MRLPWGPVWCGAWQASGMKKSEEGKALSGRKGLCGKPPVDGTCHRSGAVPGSTCQSACSPLPSALRLRSAQVPTYGPLLCSWRRTGPIAPPLPLPLPPPVGWPSCVIVFNTPCTNECIESRARCPLLHTASQSVGPRSHRMPKTKETQDKEGGAGVHSTRGTTTPQTAPPHRVLVKLVLV